MKDFFLHNIGLKLLCLLLAFISWYAIRQTISSEISIRNIPLELITTKGWAVLSKSEDSLNVTFRGSYDDIRQIDEKQIKAVVDLGAESQAGTTKISIRPKDIKGVRGARVIKVQPNYIQISLDRESAKQVSVKSRAIGNPLHGKVEQLLCEPSIVSLHGPAKQLQRIEWVYTEPVDVEMRVNSFTKRCKVLAPRGIGIDAIEPAEVKVKVLITEESESMEWTGIPVLALVRQNIPVKIQITPPNVDVTVTGRAQSLEQLKSFIPRVFVDCTHLDPSVTYDLPVSIHLPTDIDVSADAKPAFVHIVIEQPKLSIKSRID